MRAQSGWVAAVWSGAFALLIVNVAVSTYNVDALIANDRAVADSRDVSRTLADLVSSVKDAETGQRGYEITGRDDYLTPFREAEESVPREIALLRDRMAGNQFYESRLPRLQTLIDDKLAELRYTIDLRKGLDGFNRARDEIVRGHGKATMEEIRTLTREMQAHEEQILSDRQATAQAGHHWAAGTALFGGLLTIVLMGVAFVVVQRELARRQRAETEARRVADDLAAAQKEMVESLALLDAFLENAPIGMAFFDTNLRYLRINEYLATANGAAIGDHVGRVITEAIPAMPGAIVGDLREVVATRRPLLNREVTGRPGGPDRIWLSSYFPVTTHGGRVLGVGVVAQDVTDRVAATQRLRDSEARYRAVFDTAVDGIITIDEDGAVESYNPAAEQLFGYSAAEVVGRKVQMLMPDPHGSERGRVPASYLHTGEAKTIGIGRFVEGHRKDGTRFPLELAVSETNVGGRQAFTTIVRDVTERKRSEDALRHSLDRFRTLVEAVPQMVFVAEPNGTIASANGRWVEYTGRTPRELPDWTAALHPEDADAASRAWQAALETAPDRFTHECRVQSADGAFRWMLLTAVPLRTAGGVVAQWVATLTDIDDQKRQREILAALVRMRTGELESANQLLRDEIEERRRAEDRAQAAAVELGRSNDELEKFAYVASHDLQEPLRKIQAFGDRLTKKYRQSLGPDGQDYVDRMKASAGRMQVLINDLLTFSRVTTKAQPFAPVDLGEIVRDVLSDLEVRLNQSDGRVDVDDLPTIAADPLQMRQLFQNLISNALKFQKPGVPPEVTIRAVGWSSLDFNADPPPPSGAGYRITVVDNGIGFDQTYADRVFEVFQRLHGRGDYEGTGIGLAICRKIVQRHGGAIVARSQVGEGATFIIDLPTYAA
jgi:PAS domain S-box-containing protein